MPEERVLRQLVEALLFEGIASWASERHPPFSPIDREISFRVGPCTYRCRGRVGAFGRVRVVPRSIAKVMRSGLRETSWRELLEDLPCKVDVKAEVLEELQNTVRLCQWNQEQLPSLRRCRRDLSYDQLESSLHEGHPYHPCFKARAGFSLSDHAAYGPEAGQSFALRWLAVRRDCLTQHFRMAELRHFQDELGEASQRELVRARAQLGISADAYGVLPVHPWQWRSLAGTPELDAALACHELVDLKLELGQYRASQSLRTLLPVDRPHASHVKLPMSVRISSSLRTLQSETVKAAPALSAWLSSLVARDAFFSDVAGAVVLAEHGSSTYSPATPAAAALDGKLAAIWREPVQPRLRAGERALPFNALFAREPDGRPFIDEWIERCGLAAWLQQLLRVTLLPLWHLVSSHGVALEAHAQNLVLLQVDGWPSRVALRDFHDSLEYVPGFLNEPERVPDWAAIDERFRGSTAGRHYAMSSVIELRDLFIDAVLVFNLCELSWLIEQHYGFLEAEFWRLARSVLDEYARSPWSHPEREARLRLRAPYVHTESLFKARLRTPAESSFLHVIPSALHDHAEREIHAGHQ